MNVGGQQTVLITGAGGMLGGALRDLLESAGAVTVSCSRQELDISDEAAVREKLQAVRPDVVLNCAAYTKVDQAETETESAFRCNADGVGVVARCCVEVGAKLVHYSTDYVFDGSLRRPLRPEDPVGPISTYGKSKLAGEQQLREVDPPGWMIIRTAWLYGPGGANFPQSILSAARAGKPLRVVDDQRGAPTFTRDLAAATVHLLQAGATGCWHIANTGETTWFGFARAILDAFHVTPVSIEPVSSEQWARIRPGSATRPAYSVFDLEPYEVTTKQRMPRWEDGLKRYAREIGC
jgi:dTDP-4-dehydrorhamnose reductase